MPGPAWLVVPNCLPHARMGRTGNACWSALCPSGEGLTGDVLRHDRQATSTRWQVASFVRNRAPLDAPPLRSPSGSSGDPSKIWLRPPQDPCRRRCDEVMSKFDALATWHGGSDRGCNGPNGRGDTVAQGDDQPIRFRAAEQQQVELP
jgi:hypothetical protein